MLYSAEETRHWEREIAAALRLRRRPPREIVLVERRAAVFVRSTRLATLALEELEIMLTFEKETPPHTNFFCVCVASTNSERSFAPQVLQNQLVHGTEGRRIFLPRKRGTLTKKTSLPGHDPSQNSDRENFVLEEAVNRAISRPAEKSARHPCAVRDLSSLIAH